MKTIYIDSDFKCHVANDGAMMAVETKFFDGKCDAYIEGFRFVPAGKIWTREDGAIFEGEMIAAWMDYNELDQVQRQHERELARVAMILLGEAAKSLDDQTASTAAELFPHRKLDGSLIKANTRVNENGTVLRAAVDLWDTEQNSPQSAPTLWEALAYRDGYRIIPKVITVTSQFAKGERGWWKDVLYESLIDANVYTPEQYPAGWQEVE